jgi:hypothetical protein
MIWGKDVKEVGDTYAKANPQVWKQLKDEGEETVCYFVRNKVQESSCVSRLSLTLL